jgi:hypothetical protein
MKFTQDDVKPALDIISSRSFCRYNQVSTCGDYTIPRKSLTTSSTHKLHHDARTVSVDPGANEIEVAYRLSPYTHSLVAWLIDMRTISVSISLCHTITATNDIS